MERLVTTAQAAEILGISLQGVHYRIRNKKLKSIKQSGKTYVYISDEYEEPALKPTTKLEQKETATKKKTTQSQEDYRLYKKLQDEHTQKIVALKDEQITMMKKSIKWLRAQHKSEVKRLETNQKNIIEVFNSEIKLLQSAFNEMRSIYKPMLETTKEQKTTPNPKQNENKKERFISIENFTLYLKKHHKDSKEIKMIILKAVHRKDKRFLYNKKTKKILILNSDFSDLV